MTYETNDRCNCLNCAGDACQCGCQATQPELLANYAESDCRCGPNCPCEGGEQGCLCRR
jgi:hypothetical protein